MLNKKIMVLAIFFVSLLAVSAVSAVDNATDDVVSVEKTTDDIISADESDEVVSAEETTYNVVSQKNDNQVIAEGNASSFGTFSDLETEIRNVDEGGVLNLMKDYKYISGSINGIYVSKSITIDGQDHTIDGNHISRIFYITANNVTLKNINFINGKFDGNGGAVNFKSNLNSNILNSNFINCSSQFGGAIYLNSNSNCFISNSSFVNCSSEFGGAIFLDTNVNSTIENSNFKNNYAEILGGSLLAGGKGYISIVRTNFTKSSAKFESGGAITFLNTNFNAEYINVNDCCSEFGGAITLLSSFSNISYSNFKQNNASYDGGAIFAMYGSVYFEGNNFSDNFAKNGGGIYLSLTTTNLINNQFINNSASNGGAVYSITSTDKKIEGNIYINNVGSPQPNFYTTVNDNLTITCDDYYQFKYQEVNYTDLPSYYSLVDENLLTPVKNQGVDGNCWAFAAMAALESCILKASDLTFDLSEANLKNLMAFYSNYGYKIAVNDGGHPEMAYGYLASWLGPIFDVDDQYYTNDFLSPLLNSILHVQNILFLKRSSYTDNDNIKDAILRYGAVSTSMYYSSSYLKNSVSYYYSGTYDTNHAVCIVGWDDNYSKYNFKNTPQGDGAWIVKNSWGPSWGDAGYFYVSYYDKQFAKVGTTNSYTFILNDTIKLNRVYQYEIQRTSYYNTNKNEACYKNIFTVEGNEYFAGVSTYFEDECDYKLSIYLNDLLVSTKLGKTNAGYYTINLDDLIYLTKDDNVTIIFNITNIKSGLGKIPCSSKSSCTDLFIKQGISYIWDNNKWVDFYSKDCVACVKMFTTFSIDNKLNPYFQITSEGDNHDYSYLINIILPKDATGWVSINCSNQEYIIDLSTSKSIRLYGLNETNNTLLINYSGDDRYLEKIISYVVDTYISQTGTFEELSDKINNFNGDVLNLTKDYYYASGSSSEIEISKPITIDGRGYTINANNLSNIFKVNAKNVVIKNINFIGGIAENGGAIQIYSSNCSIINCTFLDNYASKNGGAIYWKGNEGFLTNCSFMSNSNNLNSLFNYGGAIYWIGENGFINNSIFIGNEGYNGGAIDWNAKFGLITDCIFANNHANRGGAIKWSGINGTIINCSFIRNTAMYGCSISASNDFLIINSSFSNHFSSNYHVISIGRNNSIINSSFINNSCYSIQLNGDNAKIVNSKFINNSGFGIAISSKSNNGLLYNCSFINCSSKYYTSAAFYLIGNDWIIKDCSFINNLGSRNGGAICLIGDNCSMINCNFTSNSAANSYSECGGGAVYWNGNGGTITDCNFINNRALRYYGGAIYYTGNNSIISNCLFVNNFAKKDGGAIYLTGDIIQLISCIFINNSVPTSQYEGGAIYWKGKMGNLLNSSFINNSAYGGSAISLYDDNITLTKCSFIDNFANGAATVYCNSNGGYFCNCSFSNNLATQLAGAIFLANNENILENCSFVNNIANDGGAVIINGNLDYLVNCAFSGNNASRYGGAIYILGTETVLNNCSFLGNVASHGGAVFVNGNDTIVNASSFINNSASNRAGAIYFLADKCILINSSFTDNFATYGSSVFWQGIDGNLINNTFASNIAFSKYGVVYWYGKNGKLINSTFINNINSTQIIWNSQLGTIEGCKFLNVTKGNVINNGARFIKRYVAITVDNYSFEYKNPIPVSAYLINVLNDLPIKSQIVFNLINGNIIETFNVNLNNNIASICDELVDYKVGICNVTSIFEGDDNYYPVESTFTLSITPAYSALNITVDNTTVGHETVLIVNVFDSNNLVIDEGIVSFFDGEAKIGESNVDNGVATLSYVPTVDGEHSIKAVFDSDNYLSSNTASKLYFDSAKVTVLVNTGTVGFNSTFVAEVKGLYSIINEGTVSFIVDEKLIGKCPVINGVASASYFPLTAKDYNVKVVFGDSDRFLDDEATTIFSVNRADSIINVVVKNNITYGENATIILTTNIDGKARIKVGTFDTTVNVTNKKATVIIPNLNANDNLYDVDVKFIVNDDNYNNSTGSSVLKVFKAKPVFAIDINDSQYKKDISLTISFADDITGYGNITVSNDNSFVLKFSNLAINNRILSQELINLNVSEYNMTFEYGGNNNYNSTMVSKTFNVFKADPVINIEVTNATYGTMARIIVNSDVEGNATITIGSIKTYENVLIDNNRIIQDITNIDAGTYPVKVTYNGNSNYNVKSFYGELIISKVLTTIVATVNDITYSESAVINVKASVDGNVIVQIDESYIDNINVFANNVAQVTFDNVPSGKHNVSITLKPSNNNYNESTYKTNFTISKKDASISLKVADSIYGEDVIVNVTAGEDGKVILNVGDITREKNVLANIQTTINLGVLSAKSYDAEVSFNAGENYKLSTQQKSFTITPAKAEITVIQVQNNTYGENTTIKVKTDVGGVLSVKINNGIKTFNIDANKLTALDLGKYDVDNYDIDLTLDAGSNYTKATGNAKVTVNPKQTTLELNVNNDIYGKNVIVNVTASENGIVTAYVGSIVRTVNVEANKQASIDFGILDAKSYEVNATFDGGKNYQTSSDKDSFVVSPKASTVSLVDFVNSYTYSDVIIKLKTDTDGTLTVKVGNIPQTKQVTAGNAVTFDFSILDVNSYGVTISLDAGNNYIPYQNTTSITIAPKSTSIALNAKDYDTSEKIIVNVTASENGEVTIQLGNIIKTENVNANVITSVDFGILDVGSYNVIANFTAGNNYINSTNSAGIKVLSKIKDDDVNISIPEMIANQENEIIVNLPNDATGTVTLSIGNKTYPFTVNNGIASVKVPILASGIYEYVISYSGDDKYSSYVTSGNINVSKPSPEIEMPPLDKPSADGSITINLPSGATGTITLVIDKKPYTFPVDKGVAKIYMPKLANGNYDYIITYSGDSRYSSFTKTGSVTINNPSNTPTQTVDKITLTLKTAKVKKSAKKLVLQATLKQGNIPLKGKMIIFKFNGKKYTAKTNVKGVAKVTIKSKVLKKLKVGKKVNYQASYANIIVKKTVKVKK